MEQVKVMISVDDDHLEQVEEVSRRLQKEGATVEQTLPGIGAMTAKVPADSVERMRRVKGVGSLEPEREISLPPPDAPVQ